MKYGCCTPCRNMEALSSIGYDYIELSGYELLGMTENEFQAAVLISRSLNLPVLGMDDFCHSSPSIVGTSFSAREVRAYTIPLLDKAAELGVRNVEIAAPTARKLPQTFDMDRARFQAVSFLQIVCEEAEKRGMDVLFEAIHRYMCNFVNTTQEAAELVREAGFSNLHLVLDFYHMNVMGEDWKNFSRYKDLVRQVHIAHCGPEYRRDFITEEDREDVRKILTVLLENGYDGTISVEAGTTNFEKEASESLRILKSEEAEVRGTLGLPPFGSVSDLA